MALELELPVIARTVGSGTARSFALTLTRRSLVACCVMSEPERLCKHYAASPSPHSHWRIASQRCVLVEVGIVRCSRLAFGRIAGIQLVMASAAVSEPHRAAAGAVGYRSDRTRLDRTQPEGIHPDTPGTKRQKKLRQEEASAPQEEPRVLEIATNMCELPSSLSTASSDMEPIAEEQAGESALLRTIVSHAVAPGSKLQTYTL